MKIDIELVKEDTAYTYIKINSLAWLQSYKGIVSDEYLKKMNTLDEMKTVSENLKKNLSDSSKRFLLKVNNEYVGIMRVRKSKYEGYSDYGELGALYLLDNVKKKGYGKLLFDKAKEELSSIGYKKMIIGCLVCNPSNDFYVRMGAELIDKVPLTLPNGELL